MNIECNAWACGIILIESDLKILAKPQKPKKKKKPKPKTKVTKNAWMHERWREIEFRETYQLIDARIRLKTWWVERFDRGNNV